MRLIDADALIKRLNYCVEQGMGSPIAYSFKHMIDDAPTVDAVSVVRCKECKHYKILEAVYECEMGLTNVAIDDFCSYGERSDNGKDIQSTDE